MKKKQLEDAPALQSSRKGIVHELARNNTKFISLIFVLLCVSSWTGFAPSLSRSDNHIPPHAAAQALKHFLGDERAQKSEFFANHLLDFRFDLAKRIE